MTGISIIGTGNMARTIGTLAVKGGNKVEIVGRDALAGKVIVDGGTTAV